MRKDKVYLAICFLLYINIFTFKCVHYEHITDILVSIFVVFIFLYAVSNNYKKSKIICIAFFFILAGDLLINLAGYKQAVILFVVTHICFLSYYFNKNRRLKSNLIILLIFLCLSGTAYFFMFNKLPQRIEKIAVLIYLFLLTAMAWRAFCVGRKEKYFLYIVLGSVLFYFTDLSVILGKLYAEKSFVILTWAIYPPALFLLSKINYSFIDE